jgi:hypothetical protein
MVSEPANDVRYHTYTPVLLIADPPDGRVHEVGVVEVTAPSSVTTPKRVPVNVNGVPSITVPPPVVFDGSNV